MHQNTCGKTNALLYFRTMVRAIEVPFFMTMTIEEKNIITIIIKEIGNNNNKNNSSKNKENIEEK